MTEHTIDCTGECVVGEDAFRAAAALLGRRGGLAGGRKGGSSRSEAKVAAAKLNAARATAAREGRPNP